MNHTILNSYTVIIDYIVNPIKGVNKENPQTKSVTFEDIEATSENEALRVARERSEHNVYTSDVYLNN